MTRVLITGAGSYLGTRLADHLNAHGMETATLDVQKPVPENAFQGFDAVIHVAGIAHQQETDANRLLYFTVNRDLAVSVAKAAKAQGVKQFIFFSSMSVYGLHTGRITAETKPAPATAYGVSKWEAEQQLNALQDGGFKVAVLRPPMIYGPGCRGNYPRLAALALKTPVFPKVHNQRSMLYVGNLCVFMEALLKSGEGGLYFPQNKAYVSTGELVKQIAKAHGRRLWQPAGLGWLIGLAARHSATLSKVFGSLTYDQAMSAAFGDAPQLDFDQTIALTERDA